MLDLDFPDGRVRGKAIGQRCLRHRLEAGIFAGTPAGTDASAAIKRARTAPATIVQDSSDRATAFSMIFHSGTVICCFATPSNFFAGSGEWMHRFLLLDVGVSDLVRGVSFQLAVEGGIAELGKLDATCFTGTMLPETSRKLTRGKDD